MAGVPDRHPPTTGATNFGLFSHQTLPCLAVSCAAAYVLSPSCLAIADVEPLADAVGSRVLPEGERQAQLRRPFRMQGANCTALRNGSAPGIVAQGTRLGLLLLGALGRLPCGCGTAREYDNYSSRTRTTRTSRSKPSQDLLQEIAAVRWG